MCKMIPVMLKKKKTHVKQYAYTWKYIQKIGEDTKLLVVDPFR